MKKLLAIALALFIVLSFGGCKKKEEVSYQVKGTVTAVADGKVTILTSSQQTLTFDIAQAKVEIDKAKIEVNDIITLTYTGTLSGTDTSKCVVSLVIDSGADYQTISGTLVSGNTTTIVIKTQDDKQLSFNITGAELHYKNGIAVGNTMYIKYIGNIVGTDTSKVKVCSVTDNNDNPAPAPTVKITAVNETVWATDDVNIRESPDVASQKIGSLDKNKSVTRTGKCDNGWSRISYSGKDAYIYSDYLTTTDPTPKPQPTPPTPTSHTMSGRVVDASMNVITITDATSGIQYAFATEGAEIHAINGILVGNVVSIDYTGEISGTDTSAVKVTKITDNDPNTDVIYGVIQSSSGTSTVTIIGDTTQKTLTFDITQAQIDCENGLQDGERISIEYYGTINDTDTSGVTVVKIADAPHIVISR